MVLSTVIDGELKRVLGNYCRSRGVKIRYVIEAALLQYLEDEIDLKAYRDRKGEEEISLKQLLAERK